MVFFCSVFCVFTCVVFFGVFDCVVFFGVFDCLEVLRFSLGGFVCLRAVVVGCAVSFGVEGSLGIQVRAKNTYKVRA